MIMDDYDGQMIFGDLVGLKLPDIRLTGEEKPRKNLTQEPCPDRGSNPGPLRDKRACYHLFHSGGLYVFGHGFLCNTYPSWSPQQALEVCKWNLGTPSFIIMRVFWPRAGPSLAIAGT